MRKRINKKGVGIKVIVLIIILLLLLFTVLIGVISKGITPGFNVFKNWVDSLSDKKCDATGITLSEYKEIYREKIDRNVVIYKSDESFFKGFEKCFPDEFKGMKFEKDNMRYNHGRILTEIDPKKGEGYIEDLIETTEDPGYKRLNVLELIEAMKIQGDYGNVLKEIEKYLKIEQAKGVNAHQSFILYLKVLKADVLSRRDEGDDKQDAIKLYEEIFGSGTGSEDRLADYRGTLEELGKLYSEQNNYDSMVDTYLNLIDFEFRQQSPWGMKIFFDNCVERLITAGDEQGVDKREMNKLIGKLSVTVEYRYSKDIVHSCKKGVYSSKYPINDWDEQAKQKLTEFMNKDVCIKKRDYDKLIN